MQCASRSAIILAAMLVMNMFGIEARAEKRVALVIGNAAYQNAPLLANPVSDADMMAAALTRVGFTVMVERNLDKPHMEAAISRFARLAQDADAALFFYAGHGTQHGGRNYLVPVDARLEDEFHLNFELTRLDDVLFAIERARGVKILILDACRNNPLIDRLNRISSTRDLVATRGFAKVDATRGMVIAYSTQPNQVAVDGTGPNSPFALALAKEIEEPGVEIGTLFRRVAQEVFKTTDQRQLPELSISLLGEFYLNTRETDVQAWAKIRLSDDPRQLEGFVAGYPKSPLLADARDRLAAIAHRQREAERERLDRDRRAREDAERAAAERERLAREQSERERLKEALARQLERDRIADEERHERLRTEQLARKDDDRPAAPEHRMAAKDDRQPSPEQEKPLPVGPEERAEPAQERNVVDEKPAAPEPADHKAKPEIRTALHTPAPESARPPPTGKPRPQGGTNGLWIINWRGGAGCGTKAGSYSISVQNGSVVDRGSGSVSTSGAAQWARTDRKGRMVRYSGVLGSGSGSGRFENERGCRGTFVARRHHEQIMGGARLFQREPPEGVGALRLGERAYVNDGSCPRGQIKELIGGAGKRGIARQRRCVDRSTAPGT